eukprot:TRINITY_DN763_c0_g1_i4.p1 TRINITY_DN763_c0_g1~~TRINITY_DN763_c0_g1_i4.p1  ORF type:complete len:249 (-),score=71.92 TRINITY_DN763_c0_g1_i4:420-1166(-)
MAPSTRLPPSRLSAASAALPPGRPGFLLARGAAAPGSRCVLYRLNLSLFPCRSPAARCHHPPCRPHVGRRRRRWRRLVDSGRLYLCRCRRRRSCCGHGRRGRRGAPAPPPFDPAGMSVRDFFGASMGRWRSQRSSHNMAFQQFEQVLSEITITPLAVPAADAADEADVAAVCALYDVDAASAAAVVRMSWEGTSDWDEDETSAGTTVLVVVEDEPGAAAGRLLRSVGYTEAVPAVGRWTMEPGGRLCS